MIPNSIFVSFLIFVTLLAKSVSHLRGGPYIHAKVIVKSHQKNVFSKLMSMAMRIFCENYASKAAPQSFNFGKQIVFIGAILDFTHRRFTVMFLCS